MSTSAPPELPGIDRRVGLHEELVVGDPDLGARQRRDDAAGHRLADAEGVAHRQHEIADLERVGIAEWQSRQRLAAGIHLEHRKVGALVGEQHLGLVLALVGQHHPDVGAALDDVIVGDDEAAVIDDDAGTERVLHPLARGPEHAVLAEEMAKQRVVAERHEAALAHRALGVDVDHGGCGALDHGGEAQIDFGPALGHVLGRGRPDQKRQAHHDRRKRRISKKHSHFSSILPISAHPPLAPGAAPDNRQP
jgi:hypothetical protein